MLDSRANCSQPQLWKTGTVTCLEAVPRAADGFISSIAQSVFSCNQSLWPSLDAVSGVKKIFLRQLRKFYYGLNIKE